MGFPSGWVSALGVHEALRMHVELSNCTEVQARLNPAHTSGIDVRAKRSTELLGYAEVVAVHPTARSRGT